MTAVALPTQPGAIAAAPVETAATLSLVGWASELEAAYKLATMVCQTAFVPQHFRGKPEETAVAMLYGHTLEMPPMVAVKSIYVVHGTPALYAQAMYAIALSKGHEIERVEATERRVVFRARRRGTQTWQTVEWTVERAAKAKYTSNSKYLENPIGMLTEKCKAEAARLVAADALAGMSSVEEIELGDYEDLGETPTTEAPAKPAGTTRQRRQRQAPAPVAPAAVHDAPRDAEPVDEVADQIAEQADQVTGELPPEQPATAPQDDEPVEGEQLCTAEQQKAVQDALKAANYVGRVRIINRVSEFVGRQVASSAELTEAEAIDLTAALWEEADNLPVVAG